MQLPWLAPGDPLPDAALAWGESDPVPGLLAAGGGLDVASLLQAYSHGIFPWFSEGQPILWWSPDPRMVLDVEHFRLHRSLRKTLERFRAAPDCEIRIDHGFETVIRACAQAPRAGQTGTWILPEMLRAYTALHQAGYAHSVETWIGGELAGGLYCVGIGRAVFGESMFARRADASKIALAALVAFCRRHGIAMIDCQQNTSHLASLGAREMPRARFLSHVARARHLAGPQWRFEPVYWSELLPARTSPTT
ncbi:leucyl/phenylalanyl-tRNA--protein transferase [Variovorax sp. DT-64]|uniref:leucyl/phenylalanyl-tRNA--protein transferase n=1 Tax=Variovorax sp. DT-64 TaxID=3396160 RepID=UPI003F1D4370